MLVRTHIEDPLFHQTIMMVVIGHQLNLEETPVFEEEMQLRKVLKKENNWRAKKIPVISCKYRV